MRIGAAPLTLFVAVATSAAGCELVFPLDGETSPPPGDGAAGDGAASDGPASDGPTRDGPTRDGPTSPISDASPPPWCPPQYVPVGDTWYRFAAATEHSWTNAAARCVDDTVLAGPGRYTHLAVISDNTEQAAILSHIGATPWVWIGYSDRIAENMFRWVTLEPSAVMLAWQPGQPDNGAGSGPQNCVRLGAVGLDDNFCTVSHPYVCECDAHPDDPSQYMP
jgi:hypothetical protein